jgi:hypothetical protein
MAKALNVNRCRNGTYLEPQPAMPAGFDQPLRGCGQVDGPRTQGNVSDL